MRKFMYSLATVGLILFFVLLFSYEKWQVVDKTAASWLYGNAFVEAFHYFGETIAVIIIGLVLAVAFSVKKQYSTASFILLVIAGNFILNQVMKHLVKRERPEMLDQLTSYSFPSGHTMASLVLLFLVAYMYTKRLSNISWQVIIWLVAACLACLAGLSRVAAGNHFLTDVLAGWGLAYAWFVLMVYMYENKMRKT